MQPASRLNCLSAGSVSLTAVSQFSLFLKADPGLNCLSAGSVSLTRELLAWWSSEPQRLNCLSAGSVSLTGNPLG